LHERDFNVQERVRLMNAHNPRFILRNHVAQASIQEAERDRFVESKMYLRVLENAFSDKPLKEILDGFDPKREF
jgi:uncharacterized protein YdiU (UPF0061 family)